MLPLRVPLSGKVYIVSRHICCLCPPLDGNILGGVPPPLNAKHNAIAPPSSLPEPTSPCPSSSNSNHNLALCSLHCHLPIPCLWLVVVCWVNGVRHCQCCHCLSVFSLPISSSTPSFVDCCFHHPRPWLQSSSSSTTTTAAAAKQQQQQQQHLGLLPHVNCYYCGDGSCSGVPVKSQLPHPATLLICRSLLPPCVPPPGKAYVFLQHLCHFCPLLGGGILCGVPPPPNAKHDASSLLTMATQRQYDVACITSTVTATATQWQC